MAGEYPRSVLIVLVIFSLVVSPMLPCATAHPHVVCPACVCCGPPPPGGACCSCGCASVQSPPSEMATP
ncbi:hypothetical protein ES319_D10G069200v1 [Gossypium barbadense]|uniref:Uncharacterized protein n=2 Tax=Gossypium TaxID=3633 RepID=A0A5J5PNE0_GOSBA|nr:hypothetical protein ES319_D10G069200v1 [Gossypium barbadense]PPD74761.1 hypothetical protein GOBAR_DD28313 [Gossypium barbadense]TYG49163.1 hypothetical protein ES288_D10G072000v1 [Gossypium darwinii]